MALASTTTASRPCRGNATYKVIFVNFLSDSGPFRGIVPRGGLAFSPLTGVTHSRRVSLFRRNETVSPAVQNVCETGSNTELLGVARALQSQSTSVVGGDAIMAGKYGYIKVKATCGNNYLSVISMIAPSPDWVVQINNMPLVRGGKFIKKSYGRLVAYDCGTDSGSEFTDPSNLSLDIPTRPRGVFRPLVRDETDRFMGRFVGFYKIIRVDKAQ